MDPIHGSFTHPSIGAVHAPAGITGNGTLRPTPDGLEIDAFASPTNWMSLFGLFGFFGGFVAAIASYDFVRKLGVGIYPLGLVVFGPMFAGLALARKLVKSKPLKVTVSWTKIRIPDLQGNQLTFLLTQKPKGVVHFSSPHSDGLVTLLTAIRTQGAQR